MSDRQEPAKVTRPMTNGDDLDLLFAAAREEQSLPLPDNIGNRLLADAMALQPLPLPRRTMKASIPAVIWQGLQEIFGGRQGVVGVAMASCVAFAFGVLAPDTAIDLIGLTNTTELAALNLDADPSVLWAEE